MIDIVNEKLKEYGKKLEANARGEVSDLDVLNAQKALLEYTEQAKDENLKNLMRQMMSLSPEESNALINQYVSSSEQSFDEGGKSNAQTLLYSNPSAPSPYPTEPDDGGFINVILISLALIIIVIIAMTVLLV